MTTDSLVDLQHRGHVLVVTLNSPDNMNALSTDMLRALKQAWDAADDPQVRAVVVTGAGKGFCSGADLRPGATQDPGFDSLRHAFHPHILAMNGLEKPVVAAINGAVAGAGLAIAFGADVRIVSEDAKFVPAFSRIGLAPDSGASQLITQVLGYSRTFTWLAMGEPATAEQLLVWGGVDEIVPQDRVVERAHELASALGGRPGRSVGLTKRLLRQSRTASLSEQLEAEAQAQELAVADPDRAIAREAFMSELGRTK